MKKWLQGISDRKELLLILLIGFGWFILGSTIHFATVLLRHQTIFADVINSARLYKTVISEVVLLCPVLYILKIRGFVMSDFNLQLTLNLIGIGVLLLLANELTFSVFSRILSAVGYVPHDHRSVIYSANLISTLLILTINSFYEEFLLNGYLFARLKNYPPDKIIFFSVMLRMSYHTYEGWVGILGVMIVGLLFSSYYARYKKLWPLMIAHGLHNALVFWALYMGQSK